MEAQWSEIEEVNERVKPFRVLRGVEANITRGRRRSTSPTTCSRSSTGSSRRSMPRFDRNPTERILAAIEHPHVDCIGHLTGRKLNRRPGADVDVERIVARAAETGTALEINSQPDRLDMRDVHARLAGEAGVRIPVTTDAHSVGALGTPSSASRQARRAWLTKEQVLNTRPWREIAKLRDVSTLPRRRRRRARLGRAYLERVRELPVLAQVEPGAIRAALPERAARGRPSRSPPCCATSTRC